MVGTIGLTALAVDGFHWRRQGPHSTAVAVAAATTSVAATTTPSSTLAPSATAATPGPTSPASASVESPSTQLDTLRAQLAAMRAEISSGGGLHAGIWRPLGPGNSSARAAAGVGGAITALAAPTPTSIEAQLRQIVESLAEERQRLQALAKFMAGPG